MARAVGAPPKAGGIAVACAEVGRLAAKQDDDQGNRGDAPAAAAILYTAAPSAGGRAGSASAVGRTGRGKWRWRLRGAVR